MPKVIIINIPMMYHCVLHVQSMLLTSADSTALILCIAMFITKAFNLVLKYVGILWNRTSGCILDKLSTTAVVFFRSEGKLKCKCLYGV